MSDVRIKRADGTWRSLVGLAGSPGVGLPGPAGSPGTTDYTQLTNKPVLATVAATGAYADLSGKPTIPAAQVQSDWNAVSGAAQILNKPTIPAAQVNSDWNSASGVSQILNKPTLGSLAALNSVPVAQGNYAAVALSPTTGTVSASMGSGTVFTITPTGACTFNASGGVAGQAATFVITTSGTTSLTLTFGTNFKTVGTLATGTTSGKVFAISFVCTNGTLWVETGRTAAM